jgi:hypothetical protein
VTRDNCGTYAGANAHKRYGEKPCDPCRLATNEYQRAWRHRTGRNTHTLVPVDSEQAS